MRNAIQDSIRKGGTTAVEKRWEPNIILTRLDSKGYATVVSIKFSFC